VVRFGLFLRAGIRPPDQARKLVLRGGKPYLWVGSRGSGPLRTRCGRGRCDAARCFREAVSAAVAAGFGSDKSR